MLGKLFKHEFKSTAKLMLTIYAVLAAITLLGTIVLSSDNIRSGKTTLGTIVLVLLMFFYILSTFALFVVTYVYMCIHFYKSMFSDQGYLTHTLPVSSFATFNVKLITSLIWMAASMILMLCSFLALLAAASRGKISNAFSSIIWSEFEAELGMSVGSLVVYLIFTLFVSCLIYLLMVFLSACIGQLFHQYKIAAAVITGIIIYFINQIASVVIMLAVNYPTLLMQTTSGSPENPAAVMDVISPLLVSSMVYSILECAIFYLACLFITHKHINLD